MPARHGADRHAGLERLRDKAGLVLKPPAPAPLRPTQNLDPHRPDLMTLMLSRCAQAGQRMRAVIPLFDLT